MDDDRANAMHRIEALFSLMARRMVGEKSTRRFCTTRRVVLLAIVIVLIAGGSVMVAVQAYRPEFDPSLEAPEVEHVSTAPDERRNSVTDLLLDLPPGEVDHPVDSFLPVAEAALKNVRENVRDYTMLLVKQERIGRNLSDEEFVFCKVRNPRDAAPPVPFSVYTKHLKPRSMAGREAIWVEGRNDNQMIAHLGGLLNVMNHWLDPHGKLAMQGNRHPITEFGIENMLETLVQNCKLFRQNADCQVRFDRSVMLEGRKCTEITIAHSEKRPGEDLHIVKFVFDDTYNLPVAYEGYGWPDRDGQQPVLLEKYTFTDLKLNVGLSEADFDPSNKAYAFR